MRLSRRRRQFYQKNYSRRRRGSENFENFSAAAADKQKTQSRRRRDPGNFGNFSAAAADQPIKLSSIVSSLMSNCAFLLD